MKIAKILVVLLIGFFIGYLFKEKPNSEAKYGETGLATNCRGLIQDNYRGYKRGNFSAKEALDSINRNCGENGLLWEE